MPRAEGATVPKLSARLSDPAHERMLYALQRDLPATVCPGLDNTPALNAGDS